MNITGKIEQLIKLGMTAAEAVCFVHNLLMQGIAIGELQRRDAERRDNVREFRKVTEG